MEGSNRKVESLSSTDCSAVHLPAHVAPYTRAHVLESVYIFSYSFGHSLSLLRCLSIGIWERVWL